ncbi:MAG: hypothetical protein JKX85_11095 [Phycisphaeraceae bacterium]|nr:hypothetical protein [Phycisphaeraceae bacterium]
MAKKRQTKSTASKKRTTARPASLSDAIELKLVARAMAKVKTGKIPTGQERSALKRHESKIEEERRWQHYATIPQKHWREMSGRQAKVLQEQAERYGIPFGSAVVCLPDVVKALHDFFSTNAKRLARPDIPEGIDPNDPDAMVWAGDADPGSWLDRVRRATALQKELEYEKSKKQVVPREDIHEAFTRIAGLIESAGEKLRRRYGNDAVDAISEVLDGLEIEIGGLSNGDADGKINSGL